MPDGAGRFRQGFSSPALLRILPSLSEFSLTGLSPSVVLLPRQLQLTPLGLMAVLQPRRARSPVWPLPLSLATTDGITTCFLFLCLLRCFSSAGSRPSGLHAFSMMGCPIRTSTDLWSFAPPRCFSQLTTSFVASGNQGIPRAPLLRFHIFVAS